MELLAMSQPSFVSPALQDVRFAMVQASLSARNAYQFQEQTII
jgi:hypothetical protein